MARQTQFALIGIIVLLIIFNTLPLVGLYCRAAGMPSWTYGELMVGSAGLARAWALLPAWLLLGVVALSVVVLLPVFGRQSDAEA